MRTATIIAFAAVQVFCIGQNTASIIPFIGAHQTPYILSTPTLSVVNLAQPYDEGQWKPVPGLEGEYVSEEGNDEASISLIDGDIINDVESSNAYTTLLESNGSLNVTVNNADGTSSKDGSNSVIKANESEENVSKQITDIIIATAESAGGDTSSEKSKKSDISIGGGSVNVTENINSTTEPNNEHRGNAAGSSVIAENESVVNKTTENGSVVTRTGLIDIIKGGRGNGAARNYDKEINDCVDCIGESSEVGGGFTTRNDSSNGGVGIEVGKELSKSTEIAISIDGTAGLTNETGELNYIGVNVGAGGPCGPTLLWL